MVGSGELVTVLSEKTVICEISYLSAIHFVKTFSFHLFFKLLLLYFTVFMLHYLFIGHAAWPVGSYLVNQGLDLGHGSESAGS